MTNKYKQEEKKCVYWTGKRRRRNQLYR